MRPASGEDAPLDLKSHPRLSSPNLPGIPSELTDTGGERGDDRVRLLGEGRQMINYAVVNRVVKYADLASSSAWSDMLFVHAVPRIIRAV